MCVCVCVSLRLLLILITDVFKAVAIVQFALLLGFMSSAVVSTLCRCKLYYVPLRYCATCFVYIYYSKKVLHHLIFTTFLSNVLYHNTKNIFLNIILPWRVGLIV